MLCKKNLLLRLALHSRFPSIRAVQEWISIVLLGIIEGVTEFLPISSTGHLLLAEQWLPRQTDLFNVLIQTGAVLAVVLIYRDRLKQFFLEWQTPAAQDYMFKLAVAFLITGCGGLLLKKMDFKLPESPVPVALATLIGGILFLIVERWLRNRPSTAEITWTIAIVVGFSQLVAAVFPGTSRSGVTILAALVLGLGRPAAAEFSFLLGIPTLLAAGALQSYKALKLPGGAHENWAHVALAFAVAAVVAFVVVKWLLKFIQTHTFVGFGWYRIILGVLILLFVQAGTK
jgi:undecaprenyl-diphosphatase